MNKFLLSMWGLRKEGIDGERGEKTQERDLDGDNNHPVIVGNRCTIMAASKTEIGTSKNSDWQRGRL